MGRKKSLTLKGRGPKVATLLFMKREPPIFGSRR